MYQLVTVLRCKYKQRELAIWHKFLNVQTWIKSNPVKKIRYLIEIENNAFCVAPNVQGCPLNQRTYQRSWRDVAPDLTLASPRPCGPQLRSSDTARGLKADSGGGCSLHSSSVAHSCRRQDPGYVSCLLTAYAYIIRRKARMVKSCTGDS